MYKFTVVFKALGDSQMNAYTLLVLNALKQSADFQFKLVAIRMLPHKL